MAVNEEKLHAFLGKAIGDIGASMSAVLMLLVENCVFRTILNTDSDPS